MTKTAEPDNTAAMAQVAARHLGARAEQVAVSRLTGDASTRAYYRAQANGASVIISIYGAPFDEMKRAAERLAEIEAVNPAARLTFASDPCAHIETTRLFLAAGLPVPRILGAEGSLAMIVFEDVGDTRLQDWLNERPESEKAAVYSRAIELIVKIQEATKMALEADSISSRMAFDEAKLRWELGFFFANYFNRYLHMRLEPAVSNGVQADFKALCAELAARPRVLTHRDYHARNIMMMGDELIIIDFQDARMGPASYDLASLVSDPYTALTADAAAGLVEHFIELKSRSALPLGDVNEFRRELDLMTVQRMLKAVGTYASQAAIGNVIYVDYIEPALERAIAAITRLNRFEPTRELLERVRRA
jgi:aminoglycoside/choline kinase family phosphotransferase